MCSTMPHTLENLIFFPPNLNLKPWSYWFVIPWKGVIFFFHTLQSSNWEPTWNLGWFSPLFWDTPKIGFSMSVTNLGPCVVASSPHRLVRCEQWVCGTCGPLPFLWTGLKIVVENQASLTQEGSTQFDTLFFVWFWSAKYLLFSWSPQEFAC